MESFVSSQMHSTMTQGDGHRARNNKHGTGRHREKQQGSRKSKPRQTKFYSDTTMADQGLVPRFVLLAVASTARSVSRFD